MPCNAHDFSLVEVLVAVLIFSLGLLGMVAPLVVATQSSHACGDLTLDNTGVKAYSDNTGNGPCW